MNRTFQSAGHTLRHIISVLRDHNLEEPEKEAETIICSLLKITRTELYRDDPPVDEDLLREIETVLAKRLRGEPLQYLTGETWFYGLRIRVGPGVLIPRPETEIVVEESVRILKELRGKSKDSGNRVALPSILDLCTGAGCIAIAIAQQFPDSEVIGTDISETAISYARENAGQNRVGNVRFMKGDLFEPVRERRFHLITSNPPYVSGNEFGSLQKEVALFEPYEALFGGVDGLDYYSRILEKAPSHLEDTGFLVLEVGAGQCDAVSDMAIESGLKRIRAIKDLAGIDRVLVFTGKG
jgi:release factor glutamine methyltransferase